MDFLDFFAALLFLSLIPYDAIIKILKLVTMNVKEEKGERER